MKYRKFGKTDWLVSEIGFGAWQIGGDWGASDDHDSVNLLLNAFERGVNFVDTAQMYGNGRSESVIGRAISEWNSADRSRIFIATKIQPTVWPESDRSAEIKGRYPPWHIRAGVDAARQRLKVDRIDLLQLHCWISDGVRNLEWLETLNELILEGKIEHIGVSLRDYRPDDGIELAKLNLVCSQQVIFNIFEQRPSQRLFKYGSNAYIARVPLDSGSLSGNWTHDTFAQWSDGSVQKYMFRDERFAETLKRVNALQQLCCGYYPTLAEAAMRYVLSFDRVSTVIPGIASITDLDRNLKYSSGEDFPAELITLLEDHSWPRNFYQ